MNVRKSIKISLAYSDKSSLWLANELGVTKQQVSNMRNKGANVRADTIERLAKVFGLSASEFIALGENSEIERAMDN